MGTKDENIHDIADLQIFITRPSTESHQEHGAVSAWTPRRETRATVERVHYALQSEQDYRPKNMSYMVIANSEAVETSEFFYDQGIVSNLIRMLSRRQGRLRNCIRFGTELFNFVFRRTIRDLLRTLQYEHNTLRVTIATDSPKLAFLPWEMMCDQRTGLLPEFLAYQPKVYFCRSLRPFSREKFQTVKLGEPDNSLRILLVTANPIAEAPLNTEVEERLLQFVIKDRPASENIELNRLHDADVNRFRATLKKFRPQVLHLSSHGAYNEREELGFVILSSPNNPQKPDWVSSYRLALLLQEVGSVQLAVVSSCYSAFPSKISPFSGIAQSLHAIGINNVVALQFPLLDKTGHTILYNLYDSIINYGVTVEESVAWVRRGLFIDGYSLSESFGLTLFQNNSTLYWPSDTATAKSNPSNLRDIRDVLEWVNRNLKDYVYKEIEKEENLFKYLESLKPKDVYTMLMVFGFNYKTGIHITKKITKIGVNPSIFFEFVRISEYLCHAEYEKAKISTSILIDSASSKKYSEDDLEDLPSDFFKGDEKVILDQAKNVDGKYWTFLVLYNDTDDTDDTTMKRKVFKKNLKGAGADEESRCNGSIANTEWANIYSLTSESGCALVLPGNGKIKIFVCCEQIAEYRNGRWLPADYKELRDTAIKSISGTELEENIIVDVLRKSLYASDNGIGAIFMIEMKDALEKHCHLEKFERLGEEQQLPSKKITEFDSQEYINQVSGDGAVILSKEGYTRYKRASLAPDPNTIVDDIPNTGMRHLFPQKITKETDAIAVVVSEDGPVTIFKDGKTVIRILDINWSENEQK